MLTGVTLYKSEETTKAAIQKFQRIACADEIYIYVYCVYVFVCVRFAYLIRLFYFSFESFLFLLREVSCV